MGDAGRKEKENSREKREIDSRECDEQERDEPHAAEKKVLFVSIQPKRHCCLFTPHVLQVCSSQRITKGMLSTHNPANQPPPIQRKHKGKKKKKKKSVPVCPRVKTSVE